VNHGSSTAFVARLQRSKAKIKSKDQKQTTEKERKPNGRSTDCIWGVSCLFRSFSVLSPFCFSGLLLIFAFDLCF